MKPTDRESGLTHDRLLQVIHYDPETGVFTRLVSKGKAKAGMRAGGISPGRGRRTQPRWKLSVDGRSYFASRLAWFYMTGQWPADEIDHRDTDSLDDRWDNLRPASRRANQANTNLYRNNRAGIRGVHRLPSGRWRAVITKDGRNRHIGYFNNAESAKAAWLTNAQQAHGEFVRAT